MRDSRSFGQILRGYRRGLGLTQENLAEKLECSVEAIKQYEADKFRPRKERAEKLAEVLELSKKERAEFLRLAHQRPNKSEASDNTDRTDQGSSSTSNTIQLEQNLLPSVKPIYKQKWLWILPASIVLALGLAAYILRQAGIIQDKATVAVPISLASPVSSPSSTTPAPSALPSGIEKFLGANCQQHDYAIGQDHTIIEVCAWINLDYDKHRLRGRAMLKYVEGPPASLTIPIVRLKQDGSTVRSNSKKPMTYTEPSIESYTELLDCGEGGPVTSEVVAVVLYQDGQQGEYTIASKGVEPHC